MDNRIENDIAQGYADFSEEGILFKRKCRIQEFSIPKMKCSLQR